MCGSAVGSGSLIAAFFQEFAGELLARSAGRGVPADSGAARQEFGAADEADLGLKWCERLVEGAANVRTATGAAAWRMESEPTGSDGG